MANPRRQLDVPGTEPPRLPELDNAIAAYVAERDERVDAQKAEASARAELFALMHDALNAGDLSADPEGNATYVYTDGEAKYRAVLSRKETARVYTERVSAPDDDGESVPIMEIDDDAA